MSGISPNNIQYPMYYQQNQFQTSQIKCSSNNYSNNFQTNIFAKLINNFKLQNEMTEINKFIENFEKETDYIDAPFQCRTNKVSNPFPFFWESLIYGKKEKISVKNQQQNNDVQQKNDTSFQINTDASLQPNFHPKIFVNNLNQNTIPPNNEIKPNNINITSSDDSSESSVSDTDINTINDNNNNNSNYYKNYSNTYYNNNNYTYNSSANYNHNFNGYKNKKNGRNRGNGSQFFYKSRQKD